MFINHEDMFSADQHNINREPVEQLFYEVM